MERKHEIMFTTEDGEVFTFHEINALITKSRSTKEIKGTVRVGIFADDTPFSMTGYYDVEGRITKDTLYFFTPKDIEVQPVRSIFKNN
jgi:hypothetical protein